jgi:hypothetical protein
VRLKASMASLKAELRQMELRIGVVSHQVSCSSSCCVTFRKCLLGHC